MKPIDTWCLSTCSIELLLVAFIALYTAFLVLAYIIQNRTDDDIITSSDHVITDFGTKGET